MRLGLVGYGLGGRYFHAPFVVAAEGVELAGVVTRSPRRRAELAGDHPGVPVFDSLSDLLASGVDAVTITTPPQTRRDLVLEALAGGVHVIADKPFAPTAQAGRDLVRAAEEAGLVLNVFHNRRWDAADCAFVVTVTHPGGVRSHLSSTKLNRTRERELRAYGGAGAYVSRGTDVQAQAVFAGLRPAELGPAWGYEAEERWSTLHTAAGAVPVPSERGAYQDYYTRFAAALRGGADFPVPAAEAVHTLEVLDAARTSAEENRVVELSG